MRFAGLTPQDPELGGVTVGKLASRGLHFPRCLICCLPCPILSAGTSQVSSPDCVAFPSEQGLPRKEREEEDGNQSSGERGVCLLSVFPLCSVTILMFNSSQRSLVLVKQFRPGETSWVDRNWGTRVCLQTLDPEGLAAAAGETEVQQEMPGPE